MPMDNRFQLTCWERIVTASLCLASLRLTPFTARMASPTCSPPHRSAGCPGWISEISIGTPCSFPPYGKSGFKLLEMYVSIKPASQQSLLQCLFHLLL